MKRKKQYEKEFAYWFEKLNDICGDKQKESIEKDILCDIYVSCEKAWEYNLQRLNNRKIKYLLIGEAAPWVKSEGVSYFYQTFDNSGEDIQPITWIRGLWNVFCSSQPPKNSERKIDIQESLNILANHNFLLVDSLPFALKSDEYKALKRKTKNGKSKYEELVCACSDFLERKLKNTKIQWSKIPKIAFAFKRNGEAVIKAHRAGIRLPSGQLLKFNYNQIAATGNGFPSKKSLCKGWSCGNSRNRNNCSGSMDRRQKSL